MVESQGIYLDWSTPTWECLACGRVATEDELDEDEEWAEAGYVRTA